jgi:hypothetical protein
VTHRNEPAPSTWTREIGHVTKLPVNKVTEKPQLQELLKDMSLGSDLRAWDEVTNAYYAKLKEWTRAEEIFQSREAIKRHQGRGRRR